MCLVQLERVQRTTVQPTGIVDRPGEAADHEQEEGLNGADPGDVGRRGIEQLARLIEGLEGSVAVDDAPARSSVPWYWGPMAYTYHVLKARKKEPATCIQARAPPLGLVAHGLDGGDDCFSSWSLPRRSSCPGGLLPSSRLLAACAPLSLVPFSVSLGEPEAPDFVAA